MDTVSAQRLTLLLEVGSLLPEAWGDPQRNSSHEVLLPLLWLALLRRRCARLRNDCVCCAAQNESPEPPKFPLRVHPEAPVDIHESKWSLGQCSRQFFLEKSSC